MGATWKEFVPYKQNSGKRQKYADTDRYASVCLIDPQLQLFYYESHNFPSGSEQQQEPTLMHFPVSPQIDDMKYGPMVTRYCNWQGNRFVSF